MPFYAVARGNTPGVYENWGECQAQINGYKGARYKKFSTEDEAKEFVQEHALNKPVVDRREKAGDEDSSNGSGAKSSEKRKHSDDEDEDEGSDKKKLATDDNNFTTDGEGYLIVYSDGACHFNGKHGQQGGIGVYFGPDHPVNVSKPVKGKTLSNNVADLQAAAAALEVAKEAGFSKIAIHTDSQFMINCMTSWIKGWKKKNWVKGDGEPVKNKEDLIALDKACEDLAVKWVHVKGQAGHEGTKEADKLARVGMKLYKAPVEDEENDDDDD